MGGLSTHAQKDNRIAIGTVDTVYSKLLGEKRTILIHVPKGDSQQSYPVLYVLDGEDYFESAVAITEQFSGVFPQMIVIGITNTERERDMTPDKVQPDKIVSKGQALQSGGGDQFIAFIQKELMPYIDGHYPTAPYRVITGHSLGGLAVVNAFFNHTALFNAYIAIDPSVWWDNQKWIKGQETKPAKNDYNNRTLFIAAANNIPKGYDTLNVYKDTSGMSVVTQAVLPLVHFLRTHQLAGLEWGYKFYPNERHGTVELNAEYDALRWLFKDYEFSARSLNEHPEWNPDSVINAHYQLVSKRMGYTVVPSEDMINELGYGCMASHQMKEALTLFLRNTTNHPTSANAFDSLGDYYVASGDKTKAIKAFTKSISLGATEETRKKLEELNKQRPIN